MGTTENGNEKWDLKTQTFHGGQDWSSLTNFIEDFSVTTNGLGTPVKALEAATVAIKSIHHYPPADFQPALSHLTTFLWPEENPTDTPLLKNMDLMLLGNGASELIDLVIRSVPAGGWRPGGTLTQYKEYERSSNADNRPTLKSDDKSAVLTCMVNPTNPTGDYMNVADMKKYIETTCPDNHTVIVDESMQPWLGPEWRADSLIHQRSWIEQMCSTRKINIWVMTSWTKIWSCTGIRLGSVIAPTASHALAIKAKQVPWSVNSMALCFLSEVIKDTDYMTQTWKLTPIWRTNIVDQLAKNFPTWEVYGKDFLSWIWVDTKSESIAERAVVLAKAAGVPIRWGKSGYNLPTYLRFAVRNPQVTAVLLDALKEL